MRLGGVPVVCRSHHNHWMWGHRGYYPECKRPYSCENVGVMFQGAYVREYSQMRGWAKTNFHSPLVSRECVGLDRRWLGRHPRTAENIEANALLR